METMETKFFSMGLVGGGGGGVAINYTPMSYLQLYSVTQLYNLYNRSTMNRSRVS